ncbi:MAG: Hpt domain-containing protein [Sulfitobacter sp.]
MIAETLPKTSITSAALQAGLGLVRQRFLKTLDTRLDHMEALLVSTDLPNDRKQALAELAREAHKIAGSAGTLGFANLGRLAARVENSIETHLEKSQINDVPDVLIDQIEEMLEEGVQQVLAGQQKSSQVA